LSPNTGRSRRREGFSQRRGNVRQEREVSKEGWEWPGKERDLAEFRREDPPQGRRVTGGAVGEAGIREGMEEEERAEPRDEIKESGAGEAGKLGRQPQLTASAARELRGLSSAQETFKEDAMRILKPPR
jgi:hypothetical protein